MSVLTTAGAPFLLLARTAAAVRRSGLALRECAVQFVELGTRSSWLVGGGLAFLGAVMVSIAWAQARKYTGNVTVVGPTRQGHVTAFNGDSADDIPATSTLNFTAGRTVPNMAIHCPAV